MIRSKLQATDRAVSPVVGVALLIAIAVILAAVIGAVVLGLGTGGADTPQAQLQAEFTDETDGEITIYHNGGEPLPADEIVISMSDDNDGSNNPMASDINDGLEDLTAGNAWEIEDDEFGGNSENPYEDIDDPSDVTSITVTWEDPNSETEYVLETFEN